MKSNTITVVKDFSPRPFGRYPKHSDFCGQNFRAQLLAPAMKEFDRVIVDLNGYNRYGRSFIDEAFGGLVRDEGWTQKELRKHLEIVHDSLPSVVQLAWTRIDSAKAPSKPEKN